MPTREDSLDDSGSEVGNPQQNSEVSQRVALRCCELGGARLGVGLDRRPCGVGADHKLDERYVGRPGVCRRLQDETGLFRRFHQPRCHLEHEGLSGFAAFDEHRPMNPDFHSIGLDVHAIYEREEGLPG